MSEWQPIESCPPDTAVLLFCPTVEPITNRARIELGVAHNTRCGTYHAWATHWMPLPDAPRSGVETTPAGATVDTNNPASAHPPEVVRLIEAARRVLDYDWGDTEIPDSWPEDQALRAALTPFRSETGS